MKVTIKQLNEQIYPALNSLNPLDANVKEAINALAQNIQEAAAKTNVQQISEQIANYEEQLKEIELKRAVKQLKAKLEAEELEVQSVFTDVKASGLEGLFVQHVPIREKDDKIRRLK